MRAPMWEIDCGNELMIAESCGPTSEARVGRILCI